MNVLGFAPSDVLIVVAVSLLICTTVCVLAMEAAVLFTPAFLFLFPTITTGFPSLTMNEAIGLALIIEAFGYTSSVLAYWYRRQVLWRCVGSIIAFTIPLALVMRLAAYKVPDIALMLAFGGLLLVLGVLVARFHGTTTTGSFRAGFQPVCNDRRDRATVLSAGAFAGLVGVAIGEITNVWLMLKKRVPVHLSVGTSAAVLHLTILATALFNLAIVYLQLGGGKPVQIPWAVAAFIIPTVIVGGQIGAWLNHHLPPRVLQRGMVGVYLLVGGFVLWRSLLSLVGPAVTG